MEPEKCWIKLAKDFQFIVDSNSLSQTELQELNPGNNISKRNLYTSLAQLRFKDMGSLEPERWDLLKHPTGCKRISDLCSEYQLGNNGDKVFISISTTKHFTYENLEGCTYLVSLNSHFDQRLMPLSSGTEFLLEGSVEEKVDEGWGPWQKGEEDVACEIQLATSFENTTNAGAPKIWSYHQFEKYYLGNCPNSKAAFREIATGNSNIRIKYYLSIFIELPIELYDSQLFPFTLNGNRVLQTLYGSESTKDFTIIVAGAVETKCHKLVLAAQSPVFEAMVSSAMKEGETGILRIDDMSEKGVKNLIRYFYGLEIPASEMDCDMALELFEASHKYKLNGLEDATAYLFFVKEKNWFNADVALELYFFTKNLEEFAEINDHVFNKIITGMNAEDLRSSARFNELKPTEALDFTLKLVDALHIKLSKK